MPGERIHVAVEGDGEPLVFTHGFGGDSETWNAQIRQFSQSFQTFRWDLLGHGASLRPANPEAYSRDIALADLNAVIARVDQPVVLIGHSLGGYLSQCRAARSPTGVRALVLIATGPGYRDPIARDNWNHGVQKVSQRFAVPAASVSLVEQHDALVMDNLDRLSMPALLIVGEKDQAYHGALRYFERRVPQTQTRIVAGAGHHVHETHAQEVNHEISRFLSGLPPLQNGC